MRIISFVPMLAVTGALLRTAVTQTNAAVPKPQDKLALGEGEVKQLLLLIDAEKKGKISKQEWMKFMEAEFDRLDKSRNGELDVKELTQSRLRVSHLVSVGKWHSPDPGAACPVQCEKRLFDLYEFFRNSLNHPYM
jgi:hypothetical protein